jgi:hypothetical protein
LDVLVEVVADRDGYLDAHAVDWATYWAPHTDGLSNAGHRQLAGLRQARAAYIASSFDLSHAAAYCFGFFRLLQATLRGTLGNPGSQFLQALAGLEVFGVRGFWDAAPRAAGAVTVRHPVFLLGRLRWPRAPTSPRFLPLVCLPPGTGPRYWSGQLFYHYRQVSLDARNGTALLVFPRAAVAERSASFGSIEWLTAALRPKPDPWSRRRAKRIADCAVGPFLERRAPELRNRAGGELAFVDLGGGSGILISQICRALLEDWPHTLAGRPFAWTLVDLDVRDPARHTGGPGLRGAMSFAEYVAADYRSWTLETAQDAVAAQWQVALVCRLLNNLSQFSVERTGDPGEHLMLAPARGGQLADSGEAGRPVLGRRPAVPHVSELAVSTGQVAMRGGLAMKQLAATDYFEALYRLACDAGRPPVAGPAVYFPVRRFNHDALRLADGSSLFERLSAVANLIVVEDVDLTPPALVHHLESHRLVGLAASDALDSQRGCSGSLLCVARRALASYLPGSRLW